MYESTGVIRYTENPYKAVVLVDWGIYLYYRALTPKARQINGQRHPPHISFVRKQTPKNLTVWRKYEGRSIKFYYENIVRFGNSYSWLNVYSTELDEIVTELQLPRLNPEPDGKLYVPTAEFTYRFHITLGNCKPQDVTPGGT